MLAKGEPVEEQHALFLVELAFFFDIRCLGFQVLLDHIESSNHLRIVHAIAAECLPLHGALITLCFQTKKGYICEINEMQARNSI